MLLKEQGQHCHLLPFRLFYFDLHYKKYIFYSKTVKNVQMFKTSLIASSHISVIATKIAQSFTIFFLLLDIRFLLT